MGSLFGVVHKAGPAGGYLVSHTTMLWNRWKSMQQQWKLYVLIARPHRYPAVYKNKARRMCF